MVNSVTRSYEYSALCDVCKFKFKASQLRLRWDGLMVCKEDWEPRHPADFFRGRNDSHVLPWTRPDDGAQGSQTWTPTWATVTGTNGIKQNSGLSASVSTPDGDYSDWITGSGAVLDTRRFAAQIVVPLGASFTFTTPWTITLPSTPVTGGTWTLLNDRGLFFSGITGAGGGSITLTTTSTDFTSYSTVRITGRYGLV